MSIDIFGRCPSCRASWAGAVALRGDIVVAATTRAILHHARAYDPAAKAFVSRLASVECHACGKTFPVIPPPAQPRAA